MSTPRDKRARAHLAPIVASGLAVCWRCTEPIDPTEPWDVGHLEDLALGGDPDLVAPEHRYCNRAAGARLGRLLRRRRRLQPARFFQGPVS